MLSPWVLCWARYGCMQEEKVPMLKPHCSPRACKVTSFLEIAVCNQDGYECLITCNQTALACRTKQFQCFSHHAGHGLLHLMHSLDCCEGGDKTRFVYSCFRRYRSVPVMPPHKREHVTTNTLLLYRYIFQRETVPYYPAPCPRKSPCHVPDFP